MYFSATTIMLLFLVISLQSATSQPSILKKYDEEIEGMKRAKIELGLFSIYTVESLEAF